MSLPKYPEYKCNTVPWLGALPVHWTLARIRHLARIGMGQTILREMLEDGPSEQALPVYSASESAEPFGYFRDPAVVLEKGDVIIGARGSIGMARAIVEAATCTQTTIWLKPRRTSINVDYFYWVLVGGREGLFPFDKTAIPMLTVEQVASGQIPMPPMDEQDAVAAFLARETSKIDALIAEQENLLALLFEKRQATISHAVTRGLNSDAPLRDSGVEWLGHIPAHWEVRRLRHAVPEVTVGIVVEPSKHYVGEGVPALRSLNILPGRIRTENLVFISDKSNDLLGKSKLHSGDVVVVRSGQAGAAAVIPPELEGCNCIDLIIIRKPSDGCEHYLCWYLASDAARVQFESGSEGAIQKHFNIETAMDLVLPWPTVDEQVRIADHLVGKLHEIDELADQARRSSSLLRERRNALIAAVVTGQIDVRGTMEQEAA